MYKNLFIFMMCCAFYSSPNAAATLTQPDTIEPLKSVPLYETISADCQGSDKAQELLSNTKLTVVVDRTSAATKDVGFTFPSTTPWSLLALYHIKKCYETGGCVRVNVGDWGSGLGFFIRHALLAGGNVNGIELECTAIEQARDCIKAVYPYLPLGVSGIASHQTFCSSVTHPSTEFMERLNQVNVAFNIIHHLSDEGVITLLQKMFENTLPEGIVVLCCDAPFMLQEKEYYEAERAKGNRFPGFGVCTRSDFKYLSEPTSPSKRVILNIHTPTKEIVARLGMGRIYKGSFPAHPFLEDTRTILIHSSEEHALSPLAEIMRFTAPYAFQNSHYLCNKFRFAELATLVESAGFEQVNGWYTDHTLDTLYPHNVKLPPQVVGSKLVIMAKKR